MKIFAGLVMLIFIGVFDASAVTNASVCSEAVFILSPKQTNLNRGDTVNLMITISNRTTKNVYCKTMKVPWKEPDGLFSKEPPHEKSEFRYIADIKIKYTDKSGNVFAETQVFPHDDIRLAPKETVNFYVKTTMPKKGGVYNVTISGVQPDWGIGNSIYNGPEVLFFKCEEILNVRIKDLRVY